MGFLGALSWSRSSLGIFSLFQYFLLSNLIASLMFSRWFRLKRYMAFFMRYFNLSWSCNSPLEIALQKHALDLRKIQTVNCVMNVYSTVGILGKKFEQRELIIQTIVISYFHVYMFHRQKPLLKWGSRLN